MNYKEERKKDAEQSGGHIYELIQRGSIVDYKCKKPYVFISYSSKDWQRVLYEIVYELCKKKGLRVYFDTKFDVGSDSWFKQFQKNMSDKNCRAVLAFVSPNYKTSYATLMELMSACEAADSAPTTVLPICIGNADCNDYDNTGLGTRRFPDYSTNDLWDKELILFNQLFNNLMIEDNDIIRNKESAKSIYTRSNEKISKYDSELDKELVFKNEHYWEPYGISKDDIDEKNKHWENLTDYEKSEKGKIYLNKWKNAKLISMILSGIDKNNIDGVNKSITDAVYDKLVELGYKDVFDKDLVESVEHSKYNVDIVNGENKISLQIVEGERVPTQDAGIREGFAFEGWFVSNTEEEWDFSNPVHEDMEICAKWETIIPDSTETKSPVKVEIQPDGKIYRITGNRSSYDAFYRIGEEGKITILRGSRIRINETYIPNKLLKQYEGMITQEGYLLCDIEELSQSTAAKVIEGVSTNGQELLNEKKLLNREVVVSLNTLGGDSDNDVIIERKSINEDTTLEVGHNIGDKIIGPIGLGGLHSDGEVPSKKSKTKKLSLEEMVKNNIVSVDDAVYVKGMEGEVGFLTLDGRVLYKNEKISLNQYVLKVLGPGSRNAYIFVYHKKTGKLLDELR